MTIDATTTPAMAPWVRGLEVQVSCLGLRRAVGGMVSEVMVGGVEGGGDEFQGIEWWMTVECGKFWVGGKELGRR
jgi:hypothetical protein